jgi:RHS repeat-associated protein
LQDANWNVTALDSINLTTGVNAGITERFTYDPYGVMQTLNSNFGSTSGSASQWRYFWQGARFQPATSLYNLRNRDYSATLGRFMQQDPSGYSAGDQNLYRAEAGNPLNGADPTGLQDENSPWTNRAIGYFRTSIGTMKDMFSVMNPMAGSVLQNMQPLPQSMDPLGITGPSPLQQFGRTLGDKVFDVTQAQMRLTTTIADPLAGAEAMEKEVDLGLTLGSALVEGFTLGAARGYLAYKEGQETGNWSQFYQWEGEVAYNAPAYLLGVFSALRGCLSAEAAALAEEAVPPAARGKAIAIEGVRDLPRTIEHQVAQETIAEMFLESGRYDRVAMRAHLSEFSGQTHVPDIQPDAMGLRPDGRIDMAEVVSPSQRPEQLRAKLQQAMRELPPEKRGRIFIHDPKGRP